MAITTYKGTDKDMKCHGGFQYELGKEYTDDWAIKCGDKGFHSCQVPMDVWTYFQPTGKRRFFQCEAGGTIDQDYADSKIASSELAIKTEIGILGIIKAQIEYVKRFAKGYVAKGYCGHAAAQGYCGHAEVHGEYSIAAAFGRDGRVLGGRIGDLLTLYQWEKIKGNWVPTSGVTVTVDGEKIKTDTWYKLVDGEFVEDDEK